MLTLRWVQNATAMLICAFGPYDHVICTGCPWNSASASNCDAPGVDAEHPHYDAPRPLTETVSTRYQTFPLVPDSALQAADAILYETPDTSTLQDRWTQFLVCMEHCAYKALRTTVPLNEISNYTWHRAYTKHVTRHCSCVVQNGNELGMILDEDANEIPSVSCPNQWMRPQWEKITWRERMMKERSLEWNFTEERTKREEEHDGTLWKFRWDRCSSSGRLFHCLHKTRDQGKKERQVISRWEVTEKCSRVTQAETKLTPTQLLTPDQIQTKSIVC